jgi:hypothetical protein
MIPSRRTHSTGPASRCAPSLLSACHVNEPPLGDGKKKSICCNDMFYAFQMYAAYVLSGCCKSRSDVAYACNGYTRMLQVYISAVVSVLSESYICCSVYTHTLQEIFHLFQTYVASVLSICCSGYTV